MPQIRCRGSAGGPATLKSGLVGVDGTPTGRDAVALAETLLDAARHLTLARVVLVRLLLGSTFHLHRPGCPMSRTDGPAQ